jgi:nucleoside-diphosphate-sugar epimerase
MPSILVTGGNGFIGRRLVQRLKDPIVWDVGHTPKVDSLDGIIHLAAVSRVAAGEEDPVECVRANALFTAEILSLAHLHQAWVLLMSTQEKGDNFYGLTKRFAEAYAKRYATKKGLKLFILRPPVVWGQGDNPGKIIPRIVAGEKLEITEAPLKIAHVDEVVNAVVKNMGSVGELDLDGDLVRLKTLRNFAEYVANPHS